MAQDPRARTQDGAGYIMDIAVFLLSANLKKVSSPATLKMHFVVNLSPNKTSFLPEVSRKLYRISRFEMLSDVIISSIEQSIMMSESHFSLIFSFISCSSTQACGSGGRLISTRFSVRFTEAIVSILKYLSSRASLQ